MTTTQMLTSARMNSRAAIDSIRRVLDAAADHMLETRIREAAQIAGVRVDGRPREAVLRELAALGVFA
jgi:hypothetical protein